ncbi:MAG: ZIP family metal transporter, partial [Gemmatimonadaceae bacterium]
SAIPLFTTIALARRPHLVAFWVPRLVFIAAGALLGAAVFHLLPQSLAEASKGKVIGFVALGMAMLALLERVVHALEPTDAIEDPHPAHGHVSHLMPISIVSDALHNLIDGVLIATAFIATPTLGVFTGAAIALHELPRELGTFALCVKGGMSPRQAILVNVATGLISVLGAVSALTIGSHVSAFGVFLLPIAAGNFLYLAFAILWSERAVLRSNRLGVSASLVLLGMAMTGLLTTA